MEYVSCEKNIKADALENLGFFVKTEEFNSGSVVQLLNSAIDGGHGEVNYTTLTWDWSNKYINYLRDEKLPYDSNESSAEALISVKVGEPSLRFSLANEKSNNKVMAVKLDLTEEHRELALLRLVALKQRMRRYYNRQTNLKHFQIGDLVL
ncbi:hypothetical protein K7X08_013718 [Anisodus acutangulus]|uniref:Uncharacterized protein n=1 Tax=Anisodus acutangulus TaxID=402998 RepID=A0A9Q1LKQ5_9SOLA|nr:hypothetical protein K7X08_013718 [Anisodus acutangulus]